MADQQNAAAGVWFCCQQAAAALSVPQVNANHSTRYVTTNDTKTRRQRTITTRLTCSFTLQEVGYCFPQHFLPRSLGMRQSDTQGFI